MRKIGVGIGTGMVLLPSLDDYGFTNGSVNFSRCPLNILERQSLACTLKGGDVGHGGGHGKWLLTFLLEVGNQRRPDDGIPAVALCPGFDGIARGGVLLA